jgi:hypothetical protein
VSVKQTYVIVCNGDGCTQRYSLVAADEIPKKATDVRASAREVGWVYQPVPHGTPSSYQGPVRPQDFCPGCARTPTAVVS